MQWLKQSTAATVLIGPFLDSTDGVTAETGLTISQADVLLDKNGAGTGAKNEASAATHDANGYYTCALDTTDTGTLGRLTLAVSESGALPVWHTYMIVPANMYDSLVAGTDTLQADLTQMGGVAQSATDLKDFADDGYDPSTDKVQGVVLVDTTTTNSDMRGTDSAALAASYTATRAGYLDELGAANIPADVDAILADTGTDGVVLAAGAVSAAAVASDAIDADALAADAGVEIAAAVWDRVLNAANHNIASSAGRRIRTLQEFQGYEGGAIWVDTVNGAAGTTTYENGTSENPVSTWADALTLNAALGFNRFHIGNGSSITLTASSANYHIAGENWTLALGGQSIAAADITGATVSGIGTGSGAHLHDCLVGTVTLADCYLSDCGLTATITCSAAGTYYLHHCYSGVAGTSTPSLDFGALVANTNVNFRAYSGGIEVQNIGATGTDNMSMEGDGQIVLNANCAGGTIAIRGNFTVTDNAGGAVTLSDAARYDEDQINAQVDAALNTAIPGSPTADSINERVKAIDALVEASGSGDLAALWTRIQAATDADSVILDATQRTAIGTALLNIALSSVEDSAAHGSVGQALALVGGAHKVTVTDDGDGSATIKVYKADGTTQWGSNLGVTTAASGDVITGAEDTVT